MSGVSTVASTTSAAPAACAAAAAAAMSVTVHDGFAGVSTHTIFVRPSVPPLTACHTLLATSYDAV